MRARLGARGAARVEGRVGVRVRAGARGLGFGVKGLGIRVTVAAGLAETHSQQW